MDVVERSFEVEVEFEGVANVGLHFENFFERVRVVGDINKLVSGGRSYFHKFASYEGACTKRKGVVT